MEHNAKKWWVLLAVCLIRVMLAIDATALNIAIPVIADEFYASLTNMQWVANAFFILAAMVQILGGHLGDSYGHKKIFLFTVLLFIISSLGAGFSVNEGMLIFFRALQGASIGIASPLTFVLIFDAFPRKEQAYARSFTVMTMGIALAIGAPIGGLFVHTIGWRWIFYINLPVGVLCYILTYFNCPSKKGERKPIDPLGTIFMVIALFGITFALNQVQNWGFTSPVFFCFLIGGLLFLFFLYLREKTQRDPIVDFSLFKKSNFFINNILRLIVQVIFLGVLFFVPLYLQNIAGISAIYSGLTMFTLTLVMSIVSPSAGKWIDKAGDKKANILSMTCFLIGSFFSLFLKGEPNFFLLSIGLILFGIGIAIAFISTITGALATVPDEKIGIATGVFLTIAWIGCALGVSLAGTVIAYISRSSLLFHLHEKAISLTSAQFELAERAAKGLTPITSLIGKIPSFTEIDVMISSVFAKTIHANGWIYILISLIGLILALSLRNRQKA